MQSSKHGKMKGIEHICPRLKQKGKHSNTFFFLYIPLQDYRNIISFKESTMELSKLLGYQPSGSFSKNQFLLS